MKRKEDLSDFVCSCSTKEEMRRRKKKANKIKPEQIMITMHIFGNIVMKCVSSLLYSCIRANGRIRKSTDIHRSREKKRNSVQFFFSFGFGWSIEIGGGFCRWCGFKLPAMLFRYACSLSLWCIQMISRRQWNGFLNTIFDCCLWSSTTFCVRYQISYYNTFILLLVAPDWYVVIKTHSFFVLF